MTTLPEREPGASVAARPRQLAPLADRKAREFLRKADPVLARVIDAHPGFRPRAWMDELPPLDAFGTLIFQVAGQQLSVAATRTIVSRIEERFGGRLPSRSEEHTSELQSHVNLVCRLLLEKKKKKKKNITT